MWASERIFFLLSLKIFFSPLAWRYSLIRRFFSGLFPSSLPPPPPKSLPEKHGFSNVNRQIYPNRLIHLLSADHSQWAMLPQRDPLWAVFAFVCWFSLDCELLEGSDPVWFSSAPSEPSMAQGERFRIDVWMDEWMHGKMVCKIISGFAIFLLFHIHVLIGDHSNSRLEGRNF